MKFTTDMLKELRQAGVYIFMDGQTVRYVGATFFGIDRPFDHTHKGWKLTYTVGRELLWIPCKSTDQATLLEEYLIAKHNPEANIQRTDWLTKPANIDKLVDLRELAASYGL